jgi:hypothetical protein
VASAEFLSGPARPEDGAGGAPLRDIPIEEPDREDLLDIMTRIYANDSQAATILNSIGFPRGLRPNFVGMTPANYWNAIFVEFQNGVMHAPYRQLISRSMRIYPANEDLRALAEHYGITRSPSVPKAVPQSQSQPGQMPAPEPPPVPPGLAAAPVPDSCHVIVRADTEDIRREAAAALTALGLRPREAWSTPHAVSYLVDSDQPDVVRHGLRNVAFGWTVVAPGQPDYLLSQLYVEGPDGRQFRLTDAPAQQTNSDVAAEVVDQYGAGFADATRSTVIDHVEPDGQGRRLDPDATLHDSGIQDGDRMRVGFETRAGAVNPLDRQDALYRVRNQITAYAEGRTGFVVRSDSTLLPTTFEVDFEQLGFGPPLVPGGEPQEILRHTILIRLGQDFPETAPEVYWLTPVFHPNVFPTYECEQSRMFPASRGTVCLGLLAESYQPSLDFGGLCQMLVDMAGFRNYSLYEPTGELGPDGKLRVRGNFYDGAAAEWVESHQDRIRDINGSVTGSVRPDAPRYPNVIEPVAIGSLVVEPVDGR